MSKRTIEVNIVPRSMKNPDLEYWLKKTPEERIEAVEFLRQQHFALFGYKDNPDFVPVITIRNRKD